MINQLKKEQKIFGKKNSDTSSTALVAKDMHSRIFKRYEESLDTVESGPTWLANSGVADIVQEAIHYRDTNEYNLYAFCIMSNHVHLVFDC